MTTLVSRFPDYITPGALPLLPQAISLHHMTKTQAELIEFVYWCSCQVLELAGIGEQADWASRTSRGLRNEARLLASMAEFRS